MVLLNAVCVLAFVHLGLSFKLPSYITPCRRSDPEFEKCAIDSGNKALPTILQGDKSIKLQKLVPLEIEEIKLQSGNNLNFKLNNCTVHGLDTTVVKTFKVDREKKHCSISVHIDRLMVLSQYTVDGRILVIPIVGQGPANITFDDGVYEYSFNYTLTERKGKTYIDFVSRNLEFSTKRNYFQLYNLFRGDSRLGEQTSKFLMESWKEVSEELYPAMKDTIEQIIFGIASRYISKVPFDELFLP